MYLGRLLTILTVIVGVTGCGFHLRQSPPLPDNVKGIAIITPSPQARLARQLSDTLTLYQIQEFNLSNSDISEIVIIDLAPEDLERRLLSIFSTGQVAEYELIYSVDYVVTFPGEPAVKGYIEVLREYQDDPNQVLAKSRELELVVSEMRRDAADRIIRLLSSQSSSNQTSSSQPSSSQPSSSQAVTN